MKFQLTAIPIFQNGLSKTNVVLGGQFWHLALSLHGNRAHGSNSWTLNLEEFWNGQMNSSSLKCSEHQSYRNTIEMLMSHHSRSSYRNIRALSLRRFQFATKDATVFGLNVLLAKRIAMSHHTTVNIFQHGLPKTHVVLGGQFWFPRSKLS